LQGDAEFLADLVAANDHVVMLPMPDALAALGQHREVLVADGPLRSFLEDWIAPSVRAHAVKRR
jgi:hypothetical protein